MMTNSGRVSPRVTWPVTSIVAIALSSLIALANCADRGHDLPFANVSTPPSPARRLIEIRNTLRDRSSTRVNLFIYYRTSKAEPWTLTTDGPGGEGTVALLATPGGINHIYIWDSMADIGARVENLVQINVIPKRGSKKGSGSTTAHFQVDNTGIFVSAGGVPVQFRDRQTATRLPGGLVLVAGGVDSLGATLRTAEVFDPATGTYTLTGMMGVERESHRAVALDDGRVVLIGGQNMTGFLDDGEVFSIATDTFTPIAGTLCDPKIDFTATLLGDDRVLIAGGYNTTTGDLMSVDLFTPTSPGTGGSLAAGVTTLFRTRRGHAAVLLQTGAVLLAGGAEMGGLPAPGEIYDPALGTVQTQAAMDQIRFFGAAAILGDGTVAISGGRDAIAGTALVAAEIYDPTMDLFAPITLATPPPPTARELGNAHPTLAGGAVFLGGTDGTQGIFTADVYVVFPLGDCATANAFCQSPGTMASARAYTVSGPLYDGSIYVSGGGSPAEIYVSPGLRGGENFTREAVMSTTRAEHTATTLPGGNILIAGGDDGISPDALDTAEVFDRVTETVMPAGVALNQGRWRHTATLLHDGTVLLAGGEDASGAIGSLEVYDPAGPSFTLLLFSLTDARFDHTATLLPDGTVLIVGGDDGTGPLASAEIVQLIDPGLNRGCPGPAPAVCATASLGFARAGHRAVALQSGDVLIVGGNGGGAGVLAEAEIYDFWMMTFQSPGSDPVLRMSHEAAILPDGRVMIIGGEDGMGNIHTSTTIFDPIALSLTAGPTLLFGHSDFVFASLPGGEVLVSGGSLGGRLTIRSEVLDSRTFLFKEIAGTDPVFARTGARTALLPDGRLLVTGGRDTSDNPRDQTEYFSP
ncbi:MAG: kelch repeat-containing protein [Planctomycetota bacterium]|nr:kelch repeat-containing protein [Planctomycetota bacterium]